MIRNLLLALASVLVLTGCAVQDNWASDEAVARATYVHDGPPALTLMTMIDNDNGTGLHTALMINGSQRVIWDPAGSFRNENIVVRDDVVFGITPAVEDVFKRYHARITFHVVVQELIVSPEIAETALRLAMGYGPVAQANCARSTADILRQLPGFEHIKVSWFPERLQRQFQEIPGVTMRRLFEYDSDDKSGVLADYVPTYL